MITCRRCGQEKEPDANNPHLCVDCVKAENNRASYLRSNQGDWLTVAKDSGVDTWLQQPGETQWEYTVWLAYRDSYPGKKPSYKEVAEQVETSVDAVYKIAHRWSFPARMQDWITECDRVTLEQRRREIIDMNKDHIDMSQKLRSKLHTAIDLVDPTALKPSDIVSLAKLATDMERKARTDTIEQDELRRGLLAGGQNPSLKKADTKQGDMGEIVKILMESGALGSITQIGVRETITREVGIKNDG